jgi:8-oxo-dGTP pyrophosphatase MutT (NUDIX family)
VNFPFNVRVYGILIHEKKILVCDEMFQMIHVTKFPGGGLHFGEGTIECLRREFKEELGIEINVIRHFYTTDFFQPSFVNPVHQVISIYYLVETADEEFLTLKENEINSLDEGGEFKFHWMDLETLKQEDFKLPIDKKVVNLLAEYRQTLI